MRIPWTVSDPREPRQRPPGGFRAFPDSVRLHSRPVRPDPAATTPDFAERPVVAVQLHLHGQHHLEALLLLPERPGANVIKLFTDKISQ
jgi:hypothetical protein